MVCSWCKLSRLHGFLTASGARRWTAAATRWIVATHNMWRLQPQVHPACLGDGHHLIQSPTLSLHRRHKGMSES